MGGNNQSFVIVIAVSLHFNLFHREGRHGKYGQSRVILLVTDTRKFSTDFKFYTAFYADLKFKILVFVIMI